MALTQVAGADLSAEFLRIAFEERLDEEVRAYAVSALGKTRATQCLKQMAPLLRSESDHLRRSAALALGRIASRTDTEILEALAGRADGDRDRIVQDAAPIRKAILIAISERDESAQVCRDKNGEPEPDPELRDTENVPLNETIEGFFDREVKPHIPDAWINLNVRDDKDSEVGKVGYEINFNRFFYEYQPPRDLEVIEAEIKTLEKEIMEMLKEVTD